MDNPGMDKLAEVAELLIVLDSSMESLARTQQGASRSVVPWSAMRIMLNEAKHRLSEAEELFDSPPRRVEAKEINVPGPTSSFASRIKRAPAPSERGPSERGPNERGPSERGRVRELVEMGQHESGLDMSSDL